MPAPRKYPQELQDRAMRLVKVNPHMLRGWYKQAAIEAGERPGKMTSDAKRIKELEAEKRELKRVNETL